MRNGQMTRMLGVLLLATILAACNSGTPAASTAPTTAPTEAPAALQPTSTGEPEPTTNVAETATAEPVATMVDVELTSEATVAAPASPPEATTESATVAPEATEVAAVAAPESTTESVAATEEPVADASAIAAEPPATAVAEVVTAIPDPWAEYAQYTIEGLRARTYGEGEIEIVQTLEETENFTRLLIAYPSDGLRLTGMLNRPRGDGPFPVVILNHGYYPLDVYQTGNGTKLAADYLAAGGI